jgi:hypothetical protein
MRASYRPDISIGLAWCWLSNPEWHEDWIDHFDDKTASSHFVDFLYNGMLVDREVYIVVDGGRAYLPLPREMKITQWQYDFFRLLDSLEHASDFERYVKQAGFTVIE